MTQVAEPEAKRWVGGGILRKEDPELITGQGRYVDDIALPGMLWLAFARCPVASATIASPCATAAPGSSHRPPSRTSAPALGSPRGTRMGGPPGYRESALRFLSGAR